MVQSDIKLWPFKVIECSGDKPMIVINYKGEEKHFGVEEMVLKKMRETVEAYLGLFRNLWNSTWICSGIVQEVYRYCGEVLE